MHLTLERPEAQGVRKPGRVRECGWGHPPGMEEWDEELSCLRTDWELDNDWPVKKKKKDKR